MFKIPSRKPGESIDALVERLKREEEERAQAGKDQSTKAPMMVSGNEGSRDQGIKGLVSSKPDQGVFDSTDKNFVKGTRSPNLGDCPTTQTMLERYGDIIGFVNGHPLCLKATAPKAQGGWEVYPQALTNACKQHGLAKVLDTLRYTANYRAAKDRAKFFWHQLKKEA